MEYNFYLEGLGCANCAAKMEEKIGKHKAVKTANVVFMKKKLIVEPVEEMTEELFSEIEKIVTGIEGHVKVVPYENRKGDQSEYKHEHHHEHGENCSCEDGCDGHHHDHEHDEHHHNHDGDDHKHDGYDHEEHKEAHGHSHGHSHGGYSGSGSDYGTMIGGIVLFVAALLLEEFKIVSWQVYVPCFVIAYFFIGYDVLLQSVKNIKAGQVFDEFFLMSVATVGALLIGEFPEAVAVMLFYKIGEHFQDKAVDSARGSIESLINIKPDYAEVIEADGSVVTKAPEEVAVGDIIEVKAGERIPLDGEVIEGNTSLNMAALTGETKPVDVSVGDEVLSGSINVTGYIKIKVKKLFEESTVSRIMDMVENAADKKSKAEQFITRFARIYTPIVCFLALFIAILPPIFGGEWSVWIYRALSFLVVSCPCALVISIPLGFFGGIGVASKNGILVKGGNYLEALADVSVIAFDKTGTLTKGTFKVNEVHAKDERLLELLAMAEKKSNHPIGKSILAAYGKEVSEEDILSFEELAGYGLVVETVHGRVLAGNEKMMKKYEIAYEKVASASTVVYGALEKNFIGSVVISDEIKEDAKQGVKLLAKEGVTHTVLLSGDSAELVAEVAKDVGVEKYFGELLPGDKLSRIEEIYTENEDVKVAYVGDGINDAPVLARVDVGIAMGGVGQDAAIEAADVVLMTDEIGKIAKAVSIAKFTRQIVTENILLALTVKALILLMIAAGYSSMWLAVFADVGVALIAVCNSIRVYKHKF